LERPVIQNCAAEPLDNQDSMNSQIELMGRNFPAAQQSLLRSAGFDNEIVVNIRGRELQHEVEQYQDGRIDSSQNELNNQGTGLPVRYHEMDCILKMLLVE
jgi:hypothetical protein